MAVPVIPAPISASAEQGIQRGLIIALLAELVGAGGGGGGGAITAAAGAFAPGWDGNHGQRTLTSSTVTTNGSVVAGARSVSFTLSADFAGAINGVARSGATILSIPFTAPSGDSLPAIPYTFSAGSLVLDVLT